MVSITSFSGKYSFLSNFFPCPIEFEGQIYPTVEHAYQAARLQEREEREWIRHAPTPGKARRMASDLKHNASWQDLRLKIMAGLLMKKFSDEKLAELLCKTGNAPLIQGNTWGDRFWGAEFEDGEWRGQNHLGKLLRVIRDRNNKRSSHG